MYSCVECVYLPLSRRDRPLLVCNAYVGIVQRMATLHRRSNTQFHARSIRTMSRVTSNTHTHTRVSIYIYKQARKTINKQTSRVLARPRQVLASDGAGPRLHPWTPTWTGDTDSCAGLVMWFAWASTSSFHGRCSRRGCVRRGPRGAPQHSRRRSSRVLRSSALSLLVVTWSLWCSLDRYILSILPNSISNHTRAVRPVLLLLLAAGKPSGKRNKCIATRRPRPRSTRSRKLTTSVLSFTDSYRNRFVRSVDKRRPTSDPSRRVVDTRSAFLRCWRHGMKRSAVR